MVGVYLSLAKVCFQDLHIGGVLVGQPERVVSFEARDYLHVYFILVAKTTYRNQGFRVTIGKTRLYQSLIDVQLQHLAPGRHYLIWVRLLLRQLEFS